MLVFGLGLSVLAIGLFCRLLFTLSTYALPMVAGLTAGFGAIRAGTPTMAALALGVVAGLGALALGWFAVASTRSMLVKASVGLLFAAPAAIAGYHLATGLGGLGLHPGIGLSLLGLLGGAMAATTAWVRMTLFNPAQSARGADVFSPSDVSL